MQNLAPFARREVAHCVVPFARGEVPDLPELSCGGRPTVWQPFGLRWPDGSLRQALCLFPIELNALAEVELPLQKGPAPAPTGDFVPLAFRLTVSAKTAFGAAAIEPQLREVLEDNAMRRVELRAARLSRTGLCVEVIVAQCRGDAHAYVDVAAFYSDPSRPEMQCKVEELAVEAQGMALLFRHPGRLCVRQATTPTGSRCVLLQGQILGDGQGIRRIGTLVPPLSGKDDPADQTLKAAVVAPVLAATSWTGTGAFGPFGEPAELPPWLQGRALRQTLALRHAAFVKGERPLPDPFANFEWSGTRNAGQTGDQMDFGVTKLSAVASSGIPSALLECEPAVLQEACRPVHMYEPDGSMLLAKDHPDWIVWSGRTHWHPGVSPDRRGKPVPEPSFESHGWSGKDRQHWSSNYLGAFAQLTGAHWARRELLWETQLFLSGQTVAPSKSTSGTDAPRGAGRTLLAACWMLLCTGDEALLQRMHERLDRVHAPQFRGKDLADGLVRTMAVHDPDARMLEGKFRYWTPWQDAIAAVGYAAAHRLTGNDNARRLAEEIALTTVRHGYLLDDKECIVATAIRWLDGQPLSPEQQRDPSYVLWSYGTGFNEWALGAVEIARMAAIARGDDATAARAALIQSRVRSTRQRPSDGWIDRMSEWDAVRWEAAR